MPREVMTDEEFAKVRRKLRDARRGIIRSVERAAKAHDSVGLRRGHLMEMRRRVEQIGVEADRLMAVLERKRPR